jgi:endonuclease-3
LTKKQRALEVIEILKKVYPDAICSLNYQKPHELLIATRLSAQCTDARVNIVTKPLFEKYNSIDDFAEAKASDVEDIIKSCGLYKTKARDIVLMCKSLRDDFNNQLPSTIEKLTTLSGIGRKTANLIIGDIFKKPAVVVDTHCIRISNRIGFADVKDPYKLEMALLKIIPENETSDFCHRIVLFGREFCKARAPLCENCPVLPVCKNPK